MPWNLKAPSEPWAYINNYFDRDEVDCIIELGTSLTIKDSVISADDPAGTTDETQRSSRNSWLEPNTDNAWIYRKLTDAIVDMNKAFFEFDLLQIENLQFTEYSSDRRSHYSKHVDAASNAAFSRKLSVVVFLSDPDEFSGGDLCLYHTNDPTVIPQTPGKIIFFPSYTLHEVTPVTKGTRYSLVTWVSGPKFR